MDARLSLRGGTVWIANRMAITMRLAGSWQVSGLNAGGLWSGECEREGRGRAACRSVPVDPACGRR